MNGNMIMHVLKDQVQDYLSHHIYDLEIVTVTIFEHTGYLSQTKLLPKQVS